MEKNEKLEQKLLNNQLSFDYENELKNQIALEIKEAAEMQEKRNNKDNFVIETDFSKVSKEDKFDRNTVYRVFNRKQKTETFVNGDQAQNLVKYTNDYVVMFDHRIIEG